MTEDDRTELLALYRSGFGVKPLARWFGTRPTTIRAEIRGLGITRWTKSNHFQPKPKTRAGGISDKTVARTQNQAWRKEWSRVRDNYWGKLWYGSREFVHRKYMRSKQGMTNQYLAKRIRTRIYKVLCANHKSAPTLEMLGCTLDEFRSHIERKFRRGMRWENYGSHWHIDHIMPCAAFDLRDPKQQRLCFHFSNLQPLEAEKNWRKHARIINPQPGLRL